MPRYRGDFHASFPVAEFRDVRFSNEDILILSISIYQRNCPWFPYRLSTNKWKSINVISLARKEVAVIGEKQNNEIRGIILVAIKCFMK